MGEVAAVAVAVAVALAVVRLWQQQWRYVEREGMTELEEISKYCIKVHSSFKNFADVSVHLLQSTETV